MLGSLDGDPLALSAGSSHVQFRCIYCGFDRRVFLHERTAGKEALVSASASGTASNGNSTGPLMSHDGWKLVFGSSARNLVSPRPPAGLLQVYASTIAPLGANCAALAAPGLRPAAAAAPAPAALRARGAARWGS